MDCATRTGLLQALLCAAALVGCHYASCPDPTCTGSTLNECHVEDCGSCPFDDESAQYQTVDCSTEGLVCVAEDGLGGCVLPSMTPCDPSTEPTTVSCGTDGMHTRFCESVGYWSERVEACTPSRVCMAGNGTVACVDEALTACEPNSAVPSRCSEDGKTVIIVGCSPVGYTVSMASTTCDATESCVAQDGLADCLLLPLQSCNPITFSGGLMRCESNTLVQQICPDIGFVAEEWESCESYELCQQQDDLAACVLDPLEPCIGTFLASCDSNVAYNAHCAVVGYLDWEDTWACSEFDRACVINEYGMAECV
jgi:hypothetical protein